MASRIQVIAKQARNTFKNLSSGHFDNNKVFLANLTKLKNLLTEVRAQDLNIEPRVADPVPVPSSPPVTYMQICENDVFSMGVFLLKSGACIPLHDHPGMNGMLKVLYGKVRISCFDKLDKPSNVKNEVEFKPPLLPYQVDILWRSVFRSVGEYTESCGPCVLGPQRDNLHQITAVDGPAAFLDILAPPYDPDDGRDCHYYSVIQPAAEEDASVHGIQQERWLLEIPQPAEFWCVGESYPGPKVTI